MHHSFSSGFEHLPAPPLSVAALATLYCTEPESAMCHEELLEYARIQLGKYDLTAEQLNEAAPILAKALHMLVEQNGGKELDLESRSDIERKVLEWCGYLQCNIS